MDTKKRRSWKTPLIVSCLLGSIGAWLCFGDRGFIHLYRTEMDRQSHMARIRQLAEENQALLEEVHRLRNDMQYVESVVRKELNLIKKNQVIYRFAKEVTASHTVSSMQVKADKSEVEGASEREVQSYEKNE